VCPNLKWIFSGYGCCGDALDFGCRFPLEMVNIHFRSTPDWLGISKGFKDSRVKGLEKIYFLNLLKSIEI
jgi:hypothetical protein